MNHKIQR